METPIGLLKEMMSHIPQEVWQKDSIKVLDVSYDKCMLKEILRTQIDSQKLSYTAINGTTEFPELYSFNLYDIVVIHPPYMDVDKKGINPTNQELQNKFISEAIKQTKDNWYIVCLWYRSWGSTEGTTLENREWTCVEDSTLEYISDVLHAPEHVKIERKHYENILPSEISKYQFTSINVEGAKEYLSHSPSWFVLHKKSPPN